MPLQLVRLDSHPHEIAVTKAAVVPNGAFFLDFTRPLQPQRLLGIGPTISLFVPVVHQGEQVGGYVISLRRGSPYFADIETLWKQRYPSKKRQPEALVDWLQVVADFAAQFPEDSK